MHSVLKEKILLPSKWIHVKSDGGKKSDQILRNIYLANYISNYQRSFGKVEFKEMQ